MAVATKTHHSNCFLKPLLVPRPRIVGYRSMASMDQDAGELAVVDDSPDRDLNRAGVYREGGERRGGDADGEFENLGVPRERGEMASSRIVGEHTLREHQAGVRKVEEEFFVVVGRDADDVFESLDLLVGGDAAIEERSGRALVRRGPPREFGHIGPVDPKFHTVPYRDLRGQSHSRDQSYDCVNVPLSNHSLVPSGAALQWWQAACSRLYLGFAD